MTESRPSSTVPQVRVELEGSRGEIASKPGTRPSVPCTTPHRWVHRTRSAVA
jgi:hypothetical protein